MKTPLAVFTLGGMTIRRDNTPVTGFISRKVEALFIYLLCDQREHPREVLAEFFWDDLPQSRSLANLRMALSSLQQQLAPYVVATRQSLTINREQAIWLDVQVLDAALEQGDQIWIRNGRLTRSGVARLEEALKLYRGDFLEGFHLRDSRGFEEWKLVQQEHLRGRVLTALDRAVQYHLDSGEYAEGIEQANRLLQFDPLRESAHRQLMRLQVGSGHRSAAVAQYETCRRLLQKELGVEPDAETVVLYNQIVQGVLEVVSPSGQVKHNIPYSSTPFVERPVEQEQIASRLDDPACRLLTLIGAGGTGKTRLALHMAMERVEDFADGVYHVALAPVQDAQYIVSTIAATLKLKSGDSPTEDLIQFLRDKHVLLVLDNFEHLLDGTNVIDELLRGTKWLKCIATSRERLALHEEWVLPIGGLDYPEEADEKAIEQCGAVRLFVQSAQRVQTEFSLAQSVAGVSRVCRMVEGMPLGVELAASWTRVMSCDQIAARIEQDLDFLETSARNVPERHRSIRVLFEHSFRILTPEEQAVLMRLSVFRGEIRLEAAEQVAGATPSVLRALVEKSLLGSDSAGVYDIHQLLRRFADEKLDESGEAESTRDAHAAYFADYVESNRKQPETDAIEIYYDDIRSAMHWAEERKNSVILLRMSAALYHFWNDRGYQTEARLWLDRVLALDDQTAPDEIRAEAIQVAGVFAWKQSDFEQARDLLERALDLERRLENTTEIANTVMYLGYVVMNMGDHEGARRHFLEMLDAGRLMEDDKIVGRALGNLGLLELELTNYPESKAYFEEALMLAEHDHARDTMNALFNNLGVLALKLEDYELAEQYMNRGLESARDAKNKVNTMIALINLGEVAHHRHDIPVAVARYVEGFPLLLEIGDKLSIVATLEMFAFLMIDLGKVETGLLLLGAAEAQRESLNTPIIPRERIRYDQFVTIAKEQLGDDTVQAIWSRGRTLSLDEANALAMTHLHL